MLPPHGGPGVALSPLAAAFLPFERDYTVVQWDQRGAAKTLSRAGGVVTSELTQESLALDGIAVAEHVRTRLGGTPQLLSVGLSWGSGVALEMARMRPDLFAAYVGTSRVAQVLGATRYSLSDVASYLQGAVVSDEQIDLGAVDLRERPLRFELPLFVIQADDDYLTPVAVARAFVALVDAPHAELVTISGGHNAMLDNVEEFLADLNERVRPIALPASP